MSGLALRLILAFLPDLKVDTYGWLVWADRLASFGPASFYSESIWTHYTPGYLYILWLQGFIRQLFQIPDPSFYYFLKVPAIICEVILGYLSYQIISKHSRQLALWASAFVMFNPVLIFDSSVWGQVDSVLTLPMLLAVYLLDRGKYVSSAVSLAIAFLVKPQAIAIFPVFGLYFLKNFSVKNIILSTFYFLLSTLLLSWPFFPNNPVLGLVDMLSRMSADYPFNSVNSFNLWGVFGLWIKDLTTFTSLSYQLWGVILFITFWLLTSLFYLKRKLSLYPLSTLACLFFFFLPTRVHERYLYPGLVFLIVTAFIAKSKELIILMTALTIVNFLNLLYVYYLYSQNSYLLNSTAVQSLSILSVILFLLLSIVLFLKND